MKLLGSGSVKDIYLDEAHTKHVALQFSDRISVFDYGALPDEIPQKGKALKQMALSFFSLLKKHGVEHACDVELSQDSDYLYLVGAKGGKFFDSESDLEFLPVEVIFRWGVPAGSSLLKRGQHKTFEHFNEPMIEFTTKLEAQDRLLSEQELSALIGSEEKIIALKATSQKVAVILKNHLESIGFELWDGKIECAWNSKTQNMTVVDSIGPDELRLNLKGLRKTPLSKELLRKWLSKTNWAFDLKKAKQSGAEDWRQFVSAPPGLGEWRQEKLSQMYQALAACFKNESSKEIYSWIQSDTLKPRVYVHGSGGREAAVRWRLEQEGCEIVNSSEQQADLYWVSMDADLANGLVDEWEQAGKWCYGPRKNAAELEWSKAYGRSVASKASIEQPLFSSDPSKLNTFKNVPVIKKNGLAAGKGVVLPETMEEAQQLCKEFAAQGDVLIEERCSGPEVSAFFAVSSGFYGIESRFLGSAQDFKRRYEGDQGPNTGGMGSFVPNSFFTKEDEKLITSWVNNTLKQLVEDNRPYNGIIYMGLMKDKAKGWVLIEYNSRFGDPETQALVAWWPEGPVLRDLLNLSVLEAPVIGESESVTTCLALVRNEYPLKAPEDFELPDWSLSSENDCLLFKANSQGGRVAYLVGKGRDRNIAGDAIFEALVESPWRDKLDWRKDILP